MNISGYMKKTLLATFLIFVTLVSITGCFPKKPEPVEQAVVPPPQEEVKAEKVEEIAAYPVNSIEEIVTTANVETDTEVSSDGNGSVKITVIEPTTINLFEAGDIDAEQAKLLYQAQIKSEDLEGNAYLEMLLHFPDTGDFFVQGKDTGIEGSTDWKTIEAAIELEPGRNPDAVKLNLVIDGKGTVWIDDVKLSKVVNGGEPQVEAPAQTTIEEGLPEEGQETAPSEQTEAPAPTAEEQKPEQPEQQKTAQ